MKKEKRFIRIYSQSCFVTGVEILVDRETGKADERSQWEMK